LHLQADADFNLKEAVSKAKVWGIAFIREFAAKAECRFPADGEIKDYLSVLNTSMSELNLDHLAKRMGREVYLSLDDLRK